MKLRSTLVFLSLFLVLIGSDAQGQLRDGDIYGKLVGWILDPESGKPVNEPFDIEITSCQEYRTPLKSFISRAKTDKRGYVAVELRPGTYCLNISPISRPSKYSFEPDRYPSDRFCKPVMIEEGKITEFWRKATLAGKLKVTLADKKGNRIIPSLQFPKYARIKVSIENSNVYYGKSAIELTDDEIMDDGEIILYKIFPDVYTVDMDFENTGFKNLERENVGIEAGKLTEVVFVVDIDDNTGVEGRVFDRNGVPLKDATVNLFQEFIVSGDFSTYTDQNGYYRIKGLPAGLFKIGIDFGEKMYESSCQIVIDKDIMKKQDITMHFSIEENQKASSKKK